MSENNWVRLQIQVKDTRPNPGAQFHNDRWFVECDVLGVLQGEWAQPTLTLILHSPTKTFATDKDELSRYKFTIELESPIITPYSGKIIVIERQ